MKIDAKIFDASAIIYAIKDFINNRSKLDYTINNDSYEFNFLTKDDELYFLSLLNDYLLRIKTAEEVKDIKQMIIQTALYDLIDEC